MKINIESRYGKPGEDGFWPDQPPVEFDKQRQPNNPIEVYGMTPGVVDGLPFEVIPGFIKLLGKVLHLPPVWRQTSRVLSQNLKGEIQATPASPSIRGGGLAPLSQQGLAEAQRNVVVWTHKKASHRYLDLP